MAKMNYKFRKKPIVIEAYQMIGNRRWDNSDWPQWMNEAWNRDPGQNSIWPDPDDPDGALLVCGTLEGVQHIDWGDWIIRGINGEIYPCKPDIFKTTYEEMNDPLAPMTPDDADAFQPIKREDIERALEKGRNAREAMLDIHFNLSRLTNNQKRCRVGDEITCRCGCKCKTCGTEFHVGETEIYSEELEAKIERLRDAASGVLDLILRQGSPDPDCWENLCLLTGRYCEPYLSFSINDLQEVS